MSKMTDEQIKKALECCIKLNAEPRNFEICKKNCPYKFNCCDREKGISVEKDILDLINRQQAEIERLKADTKRVDKDLEELDRPLTEIRTKAIKEIETKIHEKLHQAEMHGNFEPVVTREMFDSVVKEMVGEGK